jgi:hypothetical protein
MKKVLVVLIIFAISVNAYGQKMIDSISGREFPSVVDEMPSFPGGH